MESITVKITDGFTLYNHDMTEVLADVETGEILEAVRSNEYSEFYAEDSEGRSFDVAGINAWSGEVIPKSECIVIV